jgi:hypothetical protein
MIAQSGIQRHLIITNNRISAVVLVPIFPKGEDFRSGYKKSARFSVMILILLCMPSSYSLDAKASRGRPRVFSAHPPQALLPIRANSQPRNHCLPSNVSLTGLHRLAAPICTGYLERKKPQPLGISSFQAVAPPR